MSSVSALCTDFYVNQKLSLKLDLPTSRETVLDMFDRVRKELPEMDRFRRYDEELALESPETEGRYGWVALNKTAVRSGSVNPSELADAYRLHRLVVDVAPYFLSISPLDVEYAEVMFGFDLEAERNRNEVVFDALYGDSPLRALVAGRDEPVLDVQPFVGFGLDGSCERQAFVEVKTRMRSGEAASGRFESEPISVYLTIRRYGPFRGLEDFQREFDAMAADAERLTEDRVLPSVVGPIREALMAP